MTRYARRVDSNHAAVADMFRHCGFLVCDTHAAAAFVDLVVYGRRSCDPTRQVHLIEVKAPKKVSRPSAYTPAQKRMAGDGWPVAVLSTPQDVLDWIDAPKG